MMARITPGLSFVSKSRKQAIASVKGEARSTIRFLSSKATFEAFCFLRTNRNQSRRI